MGACYCILHVHRTLCRAKRIWAIARYYCNLLFGIFMALVRIKTLIEKYGKT